MSQRYTYHRICKSGWPALAAAAFFLVIFLLPVLRLTAVSPQEIALTVSYGYGDSAKGGRYLPLEISLTSQKEEVFEGCLEVKSLESDGTVYLYEYPVRLEPKSEIGEKYYIPIGTRADQLFVRILDQNGTEKAYKKLKLNVSQDVSELFIGILSDTPEKLQYLNGTGINYSALKTRTFLLEEDGFPEEAIGLDQLDVILVSNYRLRNLSEKQAAAIMDWVHGGGALFLGTGKRVDETLGRFAPELLDDSYGAPQLRSINMGEEFAVNNPEESMLDISCVDIPLHGGNVIFSSNEFPVLTVATKEEGLIAVAAYDFVDIAEFCTEQPGYVDKMFTSVLGEDRIDRLAEVIYKGNSNKFWSVQSLINTGNVDKLPDLGLYTVVVVVYLMLLGPGLYLFLKKRELQGYYRRGVIGLSLCFAAVIYLIGGKTRFSSTFFTYATVQDVTEDYVSDTTYINVRNPYNQPYSVELDPSYSVLPITRNNAYDKGKVSRFSGKEEYQVAVRMKKDTTRLDVQNVVSFSPKYFQLERKYDNDQKIGLSGEVNLFEGRVSGSITNQFDFQLEDVTLLFYGRMVMLGNMGPGETKQLDSLEAFTCPVNYSYAIANQITGGNQFGRADIKNREFLQAMERTNLLEFYLNNYLTNYSADARIVAFSTEKDENRFLKDGEGETYGLTMLTSAVPVNAGNGDSLYRSALMKLPKAIGGSYLPATNSMTGEEPVTLEYSLGNDLIIERFVLEPLSELFSDVVKDNYTIPFSGSIYFYNYNTGNYDRMRGETLEFNAEQLEWYLSPSNTITVRYVHDGDGGYNSVILPMPMVTGREK